MAEKEERKEEEEEEERMDIGGLFVPDARTTHVHGRVVKWREEGRTHSTTVMALLAAFAAYAASKRQRRPRTELD